MSTITADGAGAWPRVPFWTRGDLNATSGFFINMLVNVLVLTGLSIGVVQIPADQVTSILLPALGLQLLFGNLFYFYFVRAAIASGAGAILTLVGLMHGEKVTWFDSQPKVALGYAFGAIVCLGLAAMKLPERERERDPTDPYDVPDDEFVEGMPLPEPEPEPEKRVAVPA
ncbi:hypothetical protein BH20ACT16_BH20ACT16_15060 [soil metagenome]